jgi:hypothetical protein
LLEVEFLQGKLADNVLSYISRQSRVASCNRSLRKFILYCMTCLVFVVVQKCLEMGDFSFSELNILCGSFMENRNTITSFYFCILFIRCNRKTTEPKCIVLIDQSSIGDGMIVLQCVL